jgi:transcription elongation factor Elf1
MSHEEGFCPVCNHSELEYGERDIDSESMSYDWNCPKCGSQGTEIYNIQFVEHTIEVKGKIPKKKK